MKANRPWIRHVSWRHYISQNRLGRWRWVWNAWLTRTQSLTPGGLTWASHVLLFVADSLTLAWGWWPTCGRWSGTEAPFEAPFPQAKNMWDVTANTVCSPSTPAQVGHVKTSTHIWPRASADLQNRKQEAVLLPNFGWLEQPSWACSSYRDPPGPSSLRSFMVRPYVHTNHKAY